MNAEVLYYTLYFELHFETTICTAGIYYKKKENEIIYIPYTALDLNTKKMFSYIIVQISVYQKIIWHIVIYSASLANKRL